jgi:putative ABC transport system substrate-binding protein
VIRAIFVFICLLPTVFLPAGSRAQQPAKIPRIGYLTGATPEGQSSRIESFRQGLRELGYVEGKNIVVEYRYGELRPDRVPALAAELVR